MPLPQIRGNLLSVAQYKYIVACDRLKTGGITMAKTISGAASANHYHHANHHHDASIAGPQANSNSWARKMSNHIAYALLMYTALQIFVVMAEIKGKSHSTLPYLGLVILIAIVIPGCRRFERRWERFDAQAETVGHQAISALYRRDALGVWLAAIGLPFAIAGVWHVASAALS